jgi:flagellar M-ring protein FliF
MPEQLRKIIDRVVIWWKKFNNRQRILWISVLAVILIALAILVYAVSRPSLVSIYEADSLSEASEISDLLTDNGISFETENGGMIFKVDSKDEVTASYLLASNDYPSLPYSIENVTSGSFSQTSADKQRLWIDYLEKKFASDLTEFNGVEAASVTITLPEDDGTILAKDTEGTAAVSLTLSSSLSEDQAYGIARLVATQLGNSSTEGITILDQNMNIIYSGADSSSYSSIVSSQLTNTQKQTEWVEEQVKKALASTYTNIDVSAHLSIDYSQTDLTKHEYYAPDGQTNGMIGSQSTYSAEASNYDGDIPGTDTNDDETDYMIDTTGASSYTVDDTDTQYQNNELIEQTTDQGGSIDVDNSSVSVVGTRFVTYTEAQLQAAGELDDITYEEYQQLHSEPVEETVDDSFVSVVANATGIPASSIAFKSYVQPIYTVDASSGRSLSDILQIVLAVLIFALLGYVVFRSTRKTADEELEPELSVETLLESTQLSAEDEALDDIGYSEKSETRILIEKFVDENPEAVALLLRNWLNDEWE